MPLLRGYARVLIVALLTAVLYCAPVWATHVVQEGDTLYTIARNHGIALGDLLSWNELQSSSVIRPGQQIMLSPPAAVETKPQAPSTYTVSKGDTLWAISKETGVALQELLRINGLQSGTTIQPGLVLNLPQPSFVVGAGGVLATPLAQSRQQTAPVTTTRAEPDNMSVTPPVEEPTVLPLAVAGDAGQGRDALERLKNGPESGFAWPVNARLTSPFGKRWGRMHEGIDLGVSVGTPIRAAADGVVKSAGWSGGYGRLLVIDHGGGWETYYAHNSELRVAKGDMVRKGQVVTRSGNTGNTTGPHLHFEIRRDGKALDPLRFLN